jgi:AraC family transcriptional regulator
MICRLVNNAGVLSQPSHATENRVNYSILQKCHIGGHQSSAYSIKYVVQGTEHYSVQHKRIAVSAGNYWLVHKDTTLDVEIRSNKPVHGFCIHLQPQLVEEAYNTHVSDEDALLSDPFATASLPQLGPTLYNHNDTELGKYLRRIFGSFDLNKAVLEVEEEAFFRTLAMHLVRLQNKAARQGKALSSLRHSVKEELLRRLSIARQMLDERNTESVRLDEVAKAALLSTSHFCHSFTKVYGLSPYQYLLNTRLQRAAQMIRASHSTLSEIALDCGFSDMAAFSKSFRKTYGICPREFRNQPQA